MAERAWALWADRNMASPSAVSDKEPGFPFLLEKSRPWADAHMPELSEEHCAMALGS